MNGRLRESLDTILAGWCLGIGLSLGFGAMILTAGLLKWLWGLI